MIGVACTTLKTERKLQFDLFAICRISDAFTEIYDVLLSFSLGQAVNLLAFCYQCKIFLVVKLFY